ncbi:hypothetical protein ZTR_01166 [Talaromyces verruculosus]|nr:hypothetical protein ZTR_01166 [Talaromyces verruculosus]
MNHPGGSRLGLMTAIVFVAGFVGALIASPTADTGGRSMGRIDKARRLLTPYHANGDESSDLVGRELEEIDMTLQADRQAKDLSAWSILLKLAANRKRIALGSTAACKSGSCYGPLLAPYWQIASVVVHSVVLQFFCMILANVPLTICSAIYDQHGSKPVAYLVIVFLFFYNAAFNIANNPLLYCYPTKILPFAISAKGLNVQIVVSHAALAINQYVNPIALDNIGYYYSIFYLGMLLLGLRISIIYFAFPETNGKTEAELACLFEGNDNAAAIEGLEAGLKTAHMDEKMAPVKEV